jgi:hypothetical protein
LRQLTENDARHLILVTATPHSGKEDTFRSLLGLLSSDFATLPPDLTGPPNEPHRRRLAAHFVQRRRADIQYFMHTETPFPAREEREETYTLSRKYRRLFDRVLQYSRETITDPEGGQRRQWVRWWSILALLRSIGSSPAAAAATLRNRMPTAEAETPEGVDELGRRCVLDVESEDQAEHVPDASADGFLIWPARQSGSRGKTTPNCLRPWRWSKNFLKMAIGRSCFAALFPRLNTWHGSCAIGCPKT